MEQIFKAFGHARKYGLTLGVVSNGIATDFDNSRVNIITFDVGSLPMEGSFYLKQENRTEVEAYRKYLVDMFQLFVEKMGKNLSADNVQIAADDLISLETFLAEVLG